MKENEEGRRPRDAGAGFGAEDVPHRRPQLVDAAVLEFGGRAARGLERPKAGPTGSPSRTKTKTDAHAHTHAQESQVTLYEKPNKYQQPLALNFQGKEVLKQSTKIQKRNKRKRKGTGRKKKGEGNRRTKRKERKEKASRFYSGGSCAGWSASPTG